MKLPDGFVYNRPVPSEWQRDLERLTPRQDRTTWLQLAWLSGDPWCPVQRWCVYEMTPLQLHLEIMNGNIARGVQKEDTMEWIQLQELQGPHPRDVGHYDSVLDRFISDSLVTKQEWEMYREFRAIPRLYWVIQGENGGHKRFFSPLEQKYLTLAGRPTDPPAPGSLPYAPYDRRVFDQLARRDRLREAQNHISADQDERSTQYVHFRQQLVDWLTDGMRETLESQKLDLSNMPRTSDDPTGMIEQATQNFVETGHT